MIYTKTLPGIDNILWLIKLARPFPRTTEEIIQIAKIWNFTKSTTDFLRYFPRDEEFESGDEFLTRCEEVEMMVRQERESPAELLRSPQE